MNLIEQLRRDEGVVSYAYKDSLGYLTIGVGHLIDSRKGGKISDKIIDIILQDDVSKISKELDSRLSWLSDIDMVRRAVFYNMAFNLGVEGLLSFKNTLKCAREKDWQGVAVGMMDSLWARQVGPRATRLRDQIITGEWQ